jgi:hypothetical protein
LTDSRISVPFEGTTVSSSFVPLVAAAADAVADGGADAGRRLLRLKSQVRIDEE